jgi:hypothetical protein
VPITVTLQYFDGCPNWQEMERDVRAASERIGVDVGINLQKVETNEAAEELAFRGSPTLIVAGRDPFAEPDAPVGLSCRVYKDGDRFSGSPGVAALEEALRRAST